MQEREAAYLREKWGLEHKGEKCDHRDLDKEYYLGAATGDYVCTICGESGYGRDWVKK